MPRIVLKTSGYKPRYLSQQIAAVEADAKYSQDQKLAEYESLFESWRKRNPVVDDVIRGKSLF